MIRRGWLLACLALVVGCAVSVTYAADEPLPQRIRILSYNIHHGEGTDGKIDLERIAKVIRSVEPDLVAVQEVDRGVRRTNKMDQPAELARLTGLKVFFERNIIYQDGDYGNAVLTRLNVKRHQNHPLPSHYKGEQRGVLEVELETPQGGPPLLFLATHLDYRPDDKERQSSVKAIEELLEKRGKASVILAGDLNATPDSAVLAAFAKTWQVAAAAGKTPTYPSKEPAKQLDYVLFRPAACWKVVEVRVLEETVASDHRPILVVLEGVKGKE
jgi:endonuclease/exonuclease/phosphatase family metal-dependent hydrolase